MHPTTTNTFDRIGGYVSMNGVCGCPSGLVDTGSGCVCKLSCFPDVLACLRFDADLATQPPLAGRAARVASTKFARLAKLLTRSFLALALARPAHIIPEVHAWVRTHWFAEII